MAKSVIKGSRVQRRQQQARKQQRTRDLKKKGCALGREKRKCLSIMRRVVWNNVGAARAPSFCVFFFFPLDLLSNMYHSCLRTWNTVFGDSSMSQTTKGGEKKLFSSFFFLQLYFGKWPSQTNSSFFFSLFFFFFRSNCTVSFFFSVFFFFWYSLRQHQLSLFSGLVFCSLKKKVESLCFRFLLSLFWNYCRIAWGGCAPSLTRNGSNTEKENNNNNTHKKVVSLNAIQTARLFLCSLFAFLPSRSVSRSVHVLKYVGSEQWKQLLWI